MGYIENVTIVNEGSAKVGVHYPVGKPVTHELHIGSSLLANCQELGSKAGFSTLVLERIDLENKFVEFRQEFRDAPFDGTCDDTFWDRISQNGYCGPSDAILSPNRNFIDSIEKAKNFTDIEFSIPKYLPSEYKIQFVEATDIFVVILVSPKQITNETTDCQFFWHDKGLLIYFEKDSPNFDWDTWKESWGKQEDAEPITIGKFPGLVHGPKIGDRFGDAIPLMPELVFHKDHLLVELRSPLLTDELTKIAESMY